MENSEIYEFIKPFKHKKFTMPVMTEKEHRKYYEVCCNLGIIRDDRYPYSCRPETLLRHHEFAEKSMWKQGNRQSLTYRTNRVEENLASICRNFRFANITPWTWEVRDSRSWEVIGYVVATGPEEAAQLGTLMYAGMVPNVSVSKSPERPTWTGDNSVFVEAMNNRILGNKEAQKRKLERIEQLNKEVEDLQTMSEFLALNMSAFDIRT